MKEYWTLTQWLNEDDDIVSTSFTNFPEAVKALHDRRCDFSVFGVTNITKDDTITSVLYHEIQTDDGRLEVEPWNEPLRMSGEDWFDKIELEELRKKFKKVSKNA